MMMTCLLAVSGGDPQQGAMVMVVEVMGCVGIVIVITTLSFTVIGEGLVLCCFPALQQKHLKSCK